MLENGIHRTSATNPQELIPPQDFNVAEEIYINIIKAMGVNPDYTFEGRHTLAAFFTLVHQNINTILANVAVNIGLDRFQRPLLLQGVESELLTLRSTWNQTLKPLLIGVEFGAGSTTLMYDLPLRLHGVTYDVVYNQNDNAVKLIINIVNFGGAEKGLIEFTNTVSSFLGISILETTVSGTDMKIVLNITASSKIASLATLLEGVNEITLNDYHPIRTYIKFIELNMLQVSDLELVMIKQDLFTEHALVILEYVEKPAYEAEIFKIAVRALEVRNMNVHSKALDMLSRYAAKRAYAAEVFKIAEEEAKDENSFFRGEALKILCTYVNKPQYVERLWEAAVVGVKNDKFNRTDWLHLQVLIRWQKLSWYQKAYWKSRYALGATDEQFMQAQLAI
jgi:hypothetical protein